jgi:lipoyl(octanoyl) transferase
LRRPLEVHWLGTVPYAEGVDLQKRLVEQRQAEAIPDQLLLLEHPPVITLGVKTRDDRTHIIATPQRLEDEGVEVFASGRGGDVTYHGPGQLVGYPIVDLRPDRCDVHRYVRDLEQVLIHAVARFNVVADRTPGLTGIWVGDKKLAAIGVRIARWITSHGFALNVSTKLEHFDFIVPCGIAGKGVTSLEQLTGQHTGIQSVIPTITEAFGAVFDRTVVTPSSQLHAKVRL